MQSVLALLLLTSLAAEEPALPEPLPATLVEKVLSEQAAKVLCCVPGPQMKRRLEKGGKLNTSQAVSVAASRATVGQFLFISREAFILRTR